MALGIGISIVVGSLTGQGTASVATAIEECKYLEKGTMRNQIKIGFITYMMLCNIA